MNTQKLLIEQFDDYKSSAPSSPSSFLSSGAFSPKFIGGTERRGLLWVGNVLHNWWHSYTTFSIHCSCYIFTLQIIHYKFEFIFWNLVGATQLITELRHFLPSVGLLLLLDVQDCSLGDIISNRFDFIVFRALWSCHRLLFALLFTDCQFQYKISFQQIPWHRLVQSERF